MKDGELEQLVRHLAKLHGVTPQAMVAEALGEQDEHGHSQGPAVALSDREEPEGPDEEEAPAPDKGLRRAAWLSAMVVMGILVGVVVVGWLKFVDGPAEASIKPGQAGVPSASPSSTPASGQLVGQTFLFNFPPGFDQVSNLKPDPGVAEEYRVGSKGNYRRLITVNVRATTSNSLSDDASYRLRQIQSDTYRESSVVLAGERAALMSKVDGQEQTLFWLHAGKLLTIAVTSSDPGDSVTDFMKAVTASLRWKS